MPGVSVSIPVEGLGGGQGEWVLRVSHGARLEELHGVGLVQQLLQ